LARGKVTHEKERQKDVNDTACGGLHREKSVAETQTRKKNEKGVRKGPRRIKKQPLGDEEQKVVKLFNRKGVPVASMNRQTGGG